MKFNDQRILILAPHPDDEVFGCGGLVHRAKREGAKVFVLFMTVGTTKDFSRRGVSTHDERIREVKRVARFLKFDGYRLAFPGNQFHLRLDTVAQKDLVHEIERGKDISLEELRPTMILTCSSYDYNQDHRAVHDATITAARPAAPEVKHLPRLVLTYNLPSSAWTGREMVQPPNFLVELTAEDVDAKVEALKLYASQLKHDNNPLSLEAVRTLARLNGLMCGVPYAEGFFIKRLMV